MNKDLIIPLGVVAILASMILPVPPFLLDFLLIGNLVVALVLLLSTLYISDPLKLSSLPTMLLLATLYRLALNVSTTRLILGTGDAGQVVEAFGHFVIQGNLVVGAVVFLIISLIQFIVIAKGSERVAEVSARFTLDALPGKQMSIDADVRAGLISFEVARQKRTELQTESRFYGALDGAMKFVKGDAIAGLVIIAVNILGGFLIGVLMLGLDISGAISKYTLLTVGDGLVTQIPALLNSLAAGMVITRVTRGDDQSLARELLQQFGQLRVAKFIIAGLCLVLACVPDMPALPFIALGLLLLGSGFARLDSPKAGPPIESIFQPKSPSVLQIQLSQQLASVIHQSGQLTRELDAFRQRVFDRHGLILLRPELVVSPTCTKGFRLLMRGVPVLEQTSQGDGIEALRQMLGCLEELVTKRAAELIDDTLTRRTLDYFEREAPELVSNVVPGIVTLTQLSEVLKGLARENLPLANMDLILQSVAEHGPKATSDRALLAEVRIALRRLIASLHANNEGVIEGFTLDPVLDLTFSAAEKGSQALDLNQIKLIVDYLRERDLGASVLLVSKGSRAIVRDCLRVRGLKIPVLAHEEMVDDVTFQSLGHIEPEDAEATENLVEALAA